MNPLRCDVCRTEVGDFYVTSLSPSGELVRPQKTVAGTALNMVCANHIHPLSYAVHIAVVHPTTPAALTLTLEVKK